MMLKKIIQQGRRLGKGRKRTLLWGTLRTFVEPRTQLGIFFSIIPIVRIFV